MGCSSSGTEGTPASGGAGQANVGGGGAGAVAGSTNGGAGASSGGASGGTGAGAAGEPSAGAGTGGAAGAAGAGGGGGLGGSGPTPQGFVASPGELIFGAVQQTQSPVQSVKLSSGSASVKLVSVKLDAAAQGSAAFELMSPPADGTTIAAGQTLDVQVRFEPSAIALFESKLLIETTGPDLKTNVGLFGLGTKGLEGENEPFLKIVLDTLGYKVDVGGSGLLSTTTPLVGTEVAAPRFVAAGAGEIKIIPVARYSPEEPIPYGFYTNAETVVGTIANDQYQALNPKTDAGSKTSFADPGMSFGLFTTSKTHKTYSEDSKNAANAVKHAVRTYPLKDRAGTAVPSSYLVCFEEAANGDYQDYVFTLHNVKPAP